ncbi:NfeD family protein [Thiomicrospira sp. S5]|jgi:membrane protein implicated in regulation of membrane protease activity|uniref:NfeD family protein n=1 Tax=Thiomicrospira sp. S5 TaxID=1803865 RepID=UPI0004A78614|nr:NfeD family protein [Thiomicrospira sp. S5]AZR82078.1 hypothetical protein AYJ59_07115 [Thiomicrospira sp. S5]
MDLTPISNWILLAAGLVLIVMEMLTLTFILVFIGIGLVLTAAIGQFFWTFDNATEQLLLMAVISFVLAFVFKPHLTKRFGPNTSSSTLETLMTGDKGKLTLHNGVFRVMYKGTTYEVANAEDGDFQDGEKVIVTQIENNQAQVAKPTH